MISEKDRQEFISAAAALSSAREFAEHLGEQQGGTIRNLTDEQSKRILDAHAHMGRLVMRIAERNHIFPAFEFRERIYAIALPQPILVVIEKNKIEKLG
jgi:hypothetical protein